MRRLVARYQHATDDDIHRRQLLADIVRRAIQRMYIGRCLDVELAQTGQRDIGYRHIGSQACSHAGCSFSYHTTAQHQYLCGTHARHTTDQLAFATFRFLQIVGTIQRSHSACHLTHGL